MLELYGITADDSKIHLGEILALTVNQEENVPADDLSATIAYSGELPDIYMVVLKEKDETLFTGIVDEQQTVISDSAAYNRIIARSMAALLLDNESVPASYNHPSDSVIFKYHIEPCGLKSFKGQNKSAKESLNIPKGSSDWQAVEAFSKITYGKFPRVESDGTVCFYGIENDNVIRFSNTDGIPFNSLKENKKKCKVISNVRVKLKSNMGYDLNIKNDSADSPVKRERYVDASVSSASLYIAQQMIDRSNRMAYELELKCPQRLLNVLGAKAVLDSGITGDRDGLYVSSVYYRLTPDGESTTLKLKKEN